MSITNWHAQTLNTFSRCEGGGNDPLAQVSVLGRLARLYLSNPGGGLWILSCHGSRGLAMSNVQEVRAKGSLHDWSSMISAHEGL